MRNCLKGLLPVFFVFMIHVAVAQPTNTNWLFTYLQTQPGKELSTILSNLEKYRCQVIYMQINRDEKNKPTVETHTLNYNPDEYFNPASMVKMPLAFLAAEKLHRIGMPGLDLNTPIHFLKNHPWQTGLTSDSTAANGQPSIGHFIKKAFLVSDNDAYNRLYQFVGQQAIHDHLWAMGYKNVVIPRQFLGLTPEQGKYTNGWKFIDAKGQTLYESPEVVNTMSLPSGSPVFLGKSHINSAGQKVETPFDFTLHNRISLMDLSQMLLSIMVPEAFGAQQRFDLSATDVLFLRKWMSAYPSETDEPKYNTKKFCDSYVKFFFNDSSGQMPTNLRVFNKVGWAYGFLTDVSYVVDFEKNIEFLLAATVYVNEDETLNDGVYEYETLGRPFLYQLGQAIYQYEKQRFRAVKPNLLHVKINYDKRDPNNKRAEITEVDN